MNENKQSVGVFSVFYSFMFSIIAIFSNTKALFIIEPVFEEEEELPNRTFT
jgi:hypothetical protein